MIFALVRKGAGLGYVVVLHLSLHRHSVALLVMLWVSGWCACCRSEDDEEDEQEEGDGEGRRRISGKKTSPMEEVWDLVCQAQPKSISLHRLAKIRRSGSEGSACHWQRKLLQLYHERSALAFKFGKHINLITDGSTNSCRNICASVFYSHESDQSTFGTCQEIWPSKVVGPADGGKGRGKIMARRECDRQSAYINLPDHSRKFRPRKFSRARRSQHCTFANETKHDKKCCQWMFEDWAWHWMSMCQTMQED